MALMHRFMSVEENVAQFKEINQPNHVGISIGLGDQGLQRAEALVGAGAK